MAFSTLQPGTRMAMYLPLLQTALYNARFMRKRASLHSLGCRLNQAETSVLESQLRRRGYTVVAWGEPTDLLVVNTCSVTAEAERTCRYVIRKTLKHSPDAFVADWDDEHAPCADRPGSDRDKSLAEYSRN